ncbi:MAG TPA: hypothetical protein VK213_08445 [Bacteroidales bacterium]|nr:hypothetical protein [Bacteroidales bacterium]
MERKKYKLILALLLIISAPAAADSRSDIYNAYITSRMEKWKEVIDRMASSSSKSNSFILELVNYQYGYIGYCLGFNMEKEASKYLSLAEKNIEILEKAGYQPTMTNAYRSAFYGFRISLNKLSAPFNGPKSLNYGKRSVEQDDSNYFGYIQMGNIYFYMPATFGGSKKSAFEYYNKARRLMEKDPSLVNGNWNYLSLLVTIGQAHTYLEEYDQARVVYEYILKTEPGFTYVKNELLPALVAKMKK